MLQTIVTFIQKHPSPLLGLGLFLLVLLTAMTVATSNSTPSADITKALQKTHVKAVTAPTAKALEAVFNGIDYAWPPTGKHSVPPILIRNLPADFGAITNIKKRRELFLRTLLPIVLIENQRLREHRRLAAWLLDNELPDESSPFHVWLRVQAKVLRVRGDLSDPTVQKKLLTRLDEIPAELALAQAAIETGWGSSRFALQGNSLFGQWTYEKKGGLTPEDRDSEAKHLVASFPDLRSSVRSYMRNLNTSNAYHEFRSARAKARANGELLRAVELADYMHRYSQRGEHYISEIQHIIRSPAIAALGEANLAPAILTVEKASDNLTAQLSR